MNYIENDSRHISTLTISIINLHIQPHIFFLTNNNSNLFIHLFLIIK